jgi:hypothetical protein
MLALRRLFVPGHLLIGPDVVQKEKADAAESYTAQVPNTQNRTVYLWSVDLFIANESTPDVTAITLIEKLHGFGCHCPLACRCTVEKKSKTRRTVRFAGRPTFVSPCWRTRNLDRY